VSISAIREYVALLWSQYQEASKGRRGEILDELCRNLTIHRKAATRLMNHSSPPKLARGKGSGGRSVYSPEARAALKVLWKDMGYLGAVRLKAALPKWLPFFESPICSAEVRTELLKMSTATIERILKKDKAALCRRLNTGTKRGKSRFQTEIPVRNFTETPTDPGHCEVDCVAHCGASMSGTFVWTVTLTDIATGQTECEAIWGKNGFAVRQALMAIESRLPFPILSLYFDNGCEFLNDEVIDRFARGHREKPIKVYRGRPYHSNDQSYVEQKNYTHVRMTFGYDRIDFQLAVQLMNGVYRKEWRLLHNHFYPQLKLIKKVREGSRIRRTVSQPITPTDRLMASNSLSDGLKTRLGVEIQDCNPFELREGLRRKLRAFRLYLGKDKEKWGKYAI
jgi:hypothetical protein